MLLQQCYGFYTWRHTGRGVVMSSVVSLKKSYVQILTPSISAGDCIWIRVFKGIIMLKWCHYGGPSSNLTSVLIRGSVDTGMYRGKTTRRHREKVVVCKPIKRPQEKLNLPKPDLGLLASRVVRKQISVVSVTQYMVFCYGNLNKVIHPPLCAKWER